MPTECQRSLLSGQGWGGACGDKGTLGPRFYTWGTAQEHSEPIPRLMPSGSHSMLSAGFQAAGTGIWMHRSQVTSQTLHTYRSCLMLPTKSTKPLPMWSKPFLHSGHTAFFPGLCCSNQYVPGLTMALPSVYNYILHLCDY